MEELTLQRALENIRLYNANAKYVRIDRDARALFANGLGTDQETVERQLRFIADSRNGYGAINWSKQKRVIPQDTPLIARELLQQREGYLEAMDSVRSPLEEAPTLSTLGLLFDPFRQSERWLVWAAKTWHFLKPQTFPILDSYAMRELEGREGARIRSVENDERRYYAFVLALCRFVTPRQDWLGAMRTEDGEHFWSDWKLWDKVLFQEYERRRKEERH